ncbi:hypothetical protein DP107_06195 [Haloglomus irregulare]|uniref:Uncharacterized protein n=1 Tax=Haloglomus irregulare TaxID=2234134 RepID=A0A554NB16_9EURY|nr:hypothetical protein DP107_06195 [Haloglomus irregulare]
MDGLVVTVEAMVAVVAHAAGHDGGGLNSGVAGARRTARTVHGRDGGRALAIRSPPRSAPWSGSSLTAALAAATTPAT